MSVQNPPGPSIAPANVHTPAPGPALPGARRSLWLKTLHQWHWISSAICLMAMLLFSITGFTLNHAAQIEAKPLVTRLKATVPPALLPALQSYAEQHVDGEAPVPPQLAEWANEAFPVNLRGRSAEWSEEDAYIALPRPGGDAWLRVGLDGRAEYEVTSRGAISWLNDLHKGRNTGPVWSWFIDIFALASLVFCITGFLILKIHAANRPSTWPVIGLGIVLPAVLALLFVH
ncbi:MAG: PepSY-associated TM helix domain-containing protein [Telluria sp.]